MSSITKAAKSVWRTAQLYIGFHRDKLGNKRNEAKVWAPKNGNATIYPDSDNQEVFLHLKSTEKDPAQDVQVKLRSDRVILRRDLDTAWNGIIVEESCVSVRIGDIWVRVNSDGSVTHDDGLSTTYVEAGGHVLKKTEFVEASISSDGEELVSKTPTTLSAIRKDGMISKKRK